VIIKHYLINFHYVFVAMKLSFNKCNKSWKMFYKEEKQGRPKVTKPNLTQSDPASLIQPVWSLNPYLVQVSPSTQDAIFRVLKIKAPVKLGF
jgi:hypothetical protein